MRRFAADARTIVRRAETEARADGSRSIEAEHLLLALTIHEDATAARVLATAGLDHDALHDALDGQFRDALAAAGVELADHGLPPRRASNGPRLRMGRSGKVALQHAVVSTGKRGDNRIETSDVLIGILRAEHGTVPRALAHAQIDREQLIASAEAALTAPAS